MPSTVAGTAHPVEVSKLLSSSEGQRQEDLSYPFTVSIKSLLKSEPTNHQFGKSKRAGTSPGGRRHCLHQLADRCTQALSCYVRYHLGGALKPKVGVFPLFAQL